MATHLPQETTHQPQLKEVKWREELRISLNIFVAHSLLLLTPAYFLSDPLSLGLAMSLWKLIGVAEHGCDAFRILGS